MATVPRSPDSFTVAPTTLPGARLTVPEYQDFGSAQMQRTGQAMTTAGGVAQKAAMEAADEVNKIRINDAMNKAVAARMRLTYDDADGFMNVKGERAVSWSKDKSLDQDYTERYQKEVDDIANSLGNEQQRKLFRLSVGQEINRFTGTVKQHLATELGNYEKGVRASTIELAQNKGAKEWENPDSVSQSRRVIVNAIGSDASLSPEQKADQTIKALSPMHAAVVAAALEKNNTSYAREYLKQFDTELTEDARLRLHKAVDIGDNRVKAQTFGDEMLDSGKTQVEALAEARKRFTGAERDAAESRIKDIYGVLATAEQRDKKALGDRGWSQIMTTGRLNATTEADLADKAPEELRQIRDWLDAKRRQADGEDTEKAGLWAKLKNDGSSDPDKFLDVNLDKYQPFLSKAGFQDLVNMQAGFRKEFGKASGEARLWKQAYGLLESEIKKYKDLKKGAKPGSPEAEEYDRFRDTMVAAMQDRLQEKRSETKNPDARLDEKDIKTIGANMLRTMREQDYALWATTKPGYKIASDPTDTKNYVVKKYGDIPQDVRNDLLETWRRANPDRKFERGIYGNREEIIPRDVQKVIEQMYTTGVTKGRFQE